MTTQPAARIALEKILSPLSSFVVNCGLSLREVNSILRESAVKSVVARQLADASRVNISGIAAMTGISRAEISQILKMTDTGRNRTSDRRKSPVDRILDAWSRDRRFTSASGRSKALKIYGRGPTFEALVKAYGRGIPTRALIDELTRAGAIEMGADNEITPRKTWAINRRNAIKNITAIGDLVGNVLLSALIDLRDPVGPNISELKQRVWSATVPLVKEKSIAQAWEILNEFYNVLTRYKTNPNASTKSKKNARLTVTAAFLRESDRPIKRLRRGRRNLRRNA